MISNICMQHTCLYRFDERITLPWLNSMPLSYYMLYLIRCTAVIRRTCAILHAVNMIAHHWLTEFNTTCNVSAACDRLCYLMLITYLHAMYTLVKSRQRSNSTVSIKYTSMNFNYCGCGYAAKLVIACA